MHFSKIGVLSMLALASSVIGAPAPVEDVETSLETSQDTNVLDKRLAPIVIILIKVIGGHLLAGAAKAGVDAAKAQLEPESSKFKTFDQAREAYMKTQPQRLYEKRWPKRVKGVACYNGPYQISRGAVVEGPIHLDYKWDMYRTTYQCLEIISGSVTNKGDGGWINTGTYGTCKFNRGTYTC